MNQIGLFLRIYLHPRTAFGRVIDEGRLVFAIGIALLTVFVMQLPRQAQLARLDAWATQYRKSHPPPAATHTRKPPATTEAEDEDDSGGTPAPSGHRMALSPLQSAVNQFVGGSLFHSFPTVFSVALCFVPVALLIVTVWDGMGRVSNVMFGNFSVLLMCGLLAWAAAYLPVAIAAAVLSFRLPIWQALVLAATHTAAWWVACVYFAVLFICALRTLLGTSVLHAAGAAAGGWIAAVAGIWIYSVSGSATWYLASPCVLYYLWSNLNPSFHSLGSGLRSRQSLKRNLEILTINPRDADAHCQLGLIYAQRRQYEPAIARFKKAIEIDDREAEPWYQLGLIAHRQGRYADALHDCLVAARLDDKHSGSEVWREIGALHFLSGRVEAARQALEKYIDRREYDPEGQCWYGRVLAGIGETEAARQAFQTAIESARTMPPPRKYQVRVWATEARKELRGLRGVSGKPHANPQFAGALKTSSAALGPETRV